MKKKELQLLLIVLGILCAVMSWQFAYKRFEAKAAEIETENKELQTIVDRLEILEAKKPEYLESIEQMKTADNMVINSFASNVLREDQVMYLYNMELVAANEVKVPSVNMSAAQAVPYEGSTTTEEGYELKDEGIGMYRLESTVNLTTTNNGLKNVLHYIYDLDARKAITGVNLTVSNEGYLTGSMQLNFYYLTGTEKPYVEPKIQGVPTGTGNIFGALNGRQYGDYVPRGDAADADESEAAGGSEENE